MRKKLAKNNLLICMIMLITNVFAEQAAIRPQVIMAPAQPDTRVVQPLSTLVAANKIPLVSSQSLSATPAQQAYAIELQVVNDGQDERDKSFIKALEQVLIKNSNNPKIVTYSVVKNALANPNVYIQRYTYVNHNVAFGQQALFLQIQFDPKSITQILQQVASPAATTVVPAITASKPQVLIWLVKEVSGSKIVENESSNDIIVPILKKHAQDLNIPIVFPFDISNVKASDICSLDAAAIRAMSQQYGISTVVVGCVKEPVANNSWTSQWLLLQDNKADNFNFVGVSVDSVIMQAMRVIAPSVVSLEKPQTTKVIMRIANVNGLDQYNEVVRYLRTFSQITQVDLVTINATEVELSVNVVGGRQNLSTVLNAQNRLMRNTNAINPPPGIDLDYKWVPANNEQPKTIGTKPLL